MFNNLFEIFRYQAKKNKNKIAIITCDGKKITYEKLLSSCVNYSKKINKINKNNEPICIILEKTIESYKIILACIKLGCPYFFLDPNQPNVRIRKALKSAKCKKVITEKKNINKNTISLKYFKNIRSNNKLLKKANFTNPTYYMFTSGSSGQPKGVIINQHNIRYLIEWAKKEYSFGSETIHTALNPIYFDNSIFDFYATIFNGGTLVVFKDKEILDPEIIERVITKYKCTSWFSVPTLIKFHLQLKLFKKSNFKSIKRFIFGGEGFTIPHLKHLYSIYGKTKIYSNVYGPTECTCICSSYDINASDLKKTNNFPPIGFLNSYFDGFLYDSSKENKSNKGELVLRGPAVGSGYLDKIQNSGFKKNPLENRFDEIVYFTGDIMEYDKYNKLIYLYRKDNQIKHMGFRIELEEIESKIRNIKNIEDVIVTQYFDKNYSKLVATIKIKKMINKNIYFNYFSKSLPKYMIPQKIIFLREFPKNKNGKIDRIKIKDIVKKKINAN